MALAGSRIGVVVVDMQAKNPCYRNIPFEDVASLMTHAAVRRLLPLSKRIELADFCRSGQQSLSISSHAGGRQHHVERVPTAEGERFILSIHDEAQRRAYGHVIRLLKESEGLGMPVAIVEIRNDAMPDVPWTNPQIMEAAGKGAKTYGKSSASAVENADFVQYVRENMDRIILVGFHKGRCAYQTVLDLICNPYTKTKTIITCGQLFAGYAWDDAKGNGNVNRFYKEKTEFYLKLDELIAAVKRKLSLD